MRNMLSRIGLIDETSLKTNITNTTGWSAKGALLIDDKPFGHWSTRTFITALGLDKVWWVSWNVCDDFTAQECYNFFKAAGFETD